MKNIQVRNVSDKTHARLRSRAAAAGLSLQEYLSKNLDRLAESPTLDEVLKRIDKRSEGRLELSEAASLVRGQRDSR